MKYLCTELKKMEVPKKSVCFLVLFSFLEFLGQKESVELVNAVRFPETEKHGSWLLVQLQHRIRELQFQTVAANR